jgi:hypothetical protein
MKIKKVFIVSVVLTVFAVTASIQSFAAQGVIYGCVTKNGEIRIVNDCTKCRQGEDCISWSKAEPPRHPGRRTSRGSGFRDGERYRLDPQGRNVYQPLP